jgi:hypothetical protein
MSAISGEGRFYGQPDDGSASAFLKAVTELLPMLELKPDVVSKQRLQTALVPII